VRTEKKDIEAEIIAKYREGWSLSKIQTEYELTAFELAYILGKNKIPARIKSTTRGSDTTKVNPDGTLRIPRKIIRDLSLEKAQKIKFLITSKETLTVQLQILPEPETAS
jgi:hypothetical protein